MKKKPRTNYEPNRLSLLYMNNGGPTVLVCTVSITIESDA